MSTTPADNIRTAVMLDAIGACRAMMHTDTRTHRAGYSAPNAVLATAEWMRATFGITMTDAECSALLRIAERVQQTEGAPVPGAVLAELAAQAIEAAPPADHPDHLDAIEQATERITRHLDARGYAFDVADVQDAINAAA